MKSLVITSAFSLFVKLCFISALLGSEAKIEVNNTDTKNLTFVLITSWGGFGFNSSGTLPAAEIALRDINSRADLLPGYNLVYDEIRDSKCHRHASLDAFFDGVMSGPTKIGVIGCGCSVATEPVAEIIHRWNIPLISYGTTSARLSNITVYQNYFRAHPPSTTLTPALLAIMKEFGWRRLGLVTEDENNFRSVEESIREELTLANIEERNRQYHTEEDPRDVPDLFVESEDYRVFVLNSYPNSRITCEIFKRQHLQPKYTWIAYGWYAEATWTNADIVNCTEDQMRIVLENAISIEIFPIPDDMNQSTLSGLTPEEFQSEYRTMANSGGYEVLETTAAQLYDDLWGLALALNATMSMVSDGDINQTGCGDMPGELVPLEDFTYNNSMMGCLFTWHLRQTNFSGVSGTVYFDETFITHRATLLRYALNGSTLFRRQFATLDRDNNFRLEYENGFSKEVLYPDGIPPDGYPDIVLHHVLLPITILVDVLTCIGILFAVVCLLFNIIYRERIIVKMTSPNLNYFIIFGTISMYSSIFFYLIPSTVISTAQASCLIREWLFTIGYTLAYGALLSKLWRVYQIFHNPSPGQRIFRDWQLVIFTLTVAAVAFLLLLFGTAIPQLRGNVTQTEDLENPDGISDDGVRIKYYVLVCYKDAGPALYWKIFTIAYLVVLQALGIMLAFQTRKIKVKTLKDSSFVVANVYISSIVIVVFILAIFVLRSYLNVYSAVCACGIFILTTSFLILTFVPKMIILYKDPNGDSLKDTMTGTYSRKGSDQSNRRKSMKSESLELEQKVILLEKQVAEQEEIIEKMKQEMEPNETCLSEKNRTVVRIADCETDTQCESV